MKPFDRFKKHITEENLWLYVLNLGEYSPVIISDLKKLIFEKFDFMCGDLVLMRVIYSLNSSGYISKERFQSKSAYKTTDEGLKELERAKKYLIRIVENI